ncbi:MAG: ferrochelatase [Taibaiella sp.]|nr:ferrochelatase [Taibaiella sp.]
MSKRGILLVNLGSPDSTEVADVRRYLDEFLMDKRVIDYHYIKRAILIKGIILRTRPGRTSEAYRKIWWPEGSPLIVISERQKEKLRQLTDLPVSLGMRYGNPSIKAAMQETGGPGCH